jgi:outer membrane biosynthesis protein TonB
MDNKYAWLFLATVFESITACSTPTAVADTSRRRPILDVGHSPSLSQYFPDGARSLPKPVTAAVWVCVGIDGHVASIPSIRRSTGLSELDSAAMSWASAARFIPGSYHGEATESCTEVDVTFDPKR